MRRILFLFGFLLCHCLFHTKAGLPIRNSSGKTIAFYHQDTRWIGFDQTPELTDLASFSKVETLEFPSSDLVSLEALPDLPKLRYLNLSGTKVRDFKPLEKVRKLDSLILNGIPLQNSDLATYTSWNQLTRIELSNTKVDSLDFLGKGCAVRHLELRNTLVSDLKPLSNCSQLRELYLQGTKVRNLLPLYGLSELLHLQLDRTEVSNEEISEIRRKLPYLKIFPGLRKILDSETGLDPKP
ncbi:leucine-rich repeat domain-containing protein [Leptospira fletcheri]|uniref:Leucine-rich repeat domain-containing protein n=1 Tax=Leptospira fletcheri TaxID=2484981 RepID=A0A4R9GBD5_9LEPT|nr:leucine-rich repeat domain-containing protein [Leptospira fletcheri]